ncbi:hypothetical protein GCM10027418_08710 [Mariniluteicoccus endophyticus]
MAEWVLGVDYGTSNTAAAVWVDGEAAPRVVRLSDEAEQMPSAVLVDGPTTYVGQAAVRQSLDSPELFLANPKNHLGEGSWWFGERQVDVVDLVVAVLRRVVARASEVAGGGTPRLLVMTCPEDWQDYRRAQLEAAARAVVPCPVRIVSEPVAAATLYGVDRPDRGRVAVVDLGGGTSDVAVLRTGAENVVLAAGGAPVGGNHVDAAIVRHVLDELRGRGETALVDSLMAARTGASMLALREQVRGAKHHLADYEHATIRVQDPAGSASVTLTAEGLRELTAPLVDQVVALVRDVAAKSGVPVGELQEVYLTGGSSRLRMVHEALTSLFGRPPLMRHDPKTVTVLGALHHVAAEDAAVDQPTTRNTSRHPLAPAKGATAGGAVAGGAAAYAPRPVPPQTPPTGGSARSAASVPSAADAPWPAATPSHDPWQAASADARAPQATQTPQTDPPRGWGRPADQAATSSAAASVREEAPAPKGRAKLWIPAVVVALVVAGLVTALALRPGAEPKTEQTSPGVVLNPVPTPTDETTSESSGSTAPLTPDQQANRTKLRQLVTADLSQCSFTDAFAGADLSISPVLSASCHEMQFDSPVVRSVDYELYRDEAAAARELEGMRRDAGRCPAEGMSEYATEGRTGLVGCLANRVAWYQRGKPVVANYWDDLSVEKVNPELYKYWETHNRIGR